MLQNARAHPKTEILLMAEILHQLRLVVYPIIYRVLYIPGPRWCRISSPTVATFQKGNSSSNSSVFFGATCQFQGGYVYHKYTSRANMQISTSVTTVCEKIVGLLCL